MQQKAYIAGVGMTSFGKHLDRNLKSLAGEAFTDALADAGLNKSAIEAAWVGNVGAGVISGQVCVPGQIVLRELGVGHIPVVNVENACASSGTAFQQACSMVSLGGHDVVLALGMEKLYAEDKQRTFSVFTGGVDVECADELLGRAQARRTQMGYDLDAGGAGTTRSLFVDIYADWALTHMERYGTSLSQLAAVVAKNSQHGALNPYAQFREVLSIDDVLAAREILYPLTLPMCSPIGDGAAAVIVVSEQKARQLGLSRMVKVEAATLSSGYDYDVASDIAPPQSAANAIYELAGIGPEELDVIELHDASAISEIMYYEYLGLCGPGAGGELAASGATGLGGRIPVNTSGGLMRKGHPVGATGASQIVELVWQLRGEADRRQVQGASCGLAENGGGFIGNDVAAIMLAILSR